MEEIDTLTTVRCHQAIMFALLMVITATLPLYARTTDNLTPRLDHIGILVRSTKETTQFLTSFLGFRLNSVKWQVGGDTPQSGGMKLGFVDGLGMQFTLIEPTSPGPVLEDLHFKGNGTFYELDFEVADFDATVDELGASGVPIVNMDGNPFPPGKRGWLVEPYGLRLIYIPRNVSQGMTIEVYQRGPESADILYKRDQELKRLPPVVSGALQLSHIVIIVDSLEKAAEFLMKTLRLHPAEESIRVEPHQERAAFKCQLLSDGVGTRVELVQPVASSAGVQLLAAKGTGYVTELVYKVANFPSFMQRMKDKHMPMVVPGQLDMSQRVIGCLAATARYKVASFPLDRSHGMRFTVMSAD